MATKRERARAAGGTGRAGTTTKQRTRRAATDLVVDPAALARHARTQRWFDDDGRQLASVVVTKTHELATTDRDGRYALVHFDARWDDGAASRFCAPIRVGAQGDVDDAARVPQFRAALLAAVGGGARFARPATERAALRADDEGPGATRARAAVARGFTTPDRVAWVVEQAKKLDVANHDALVDAFFAAVERTLSAQREEVRAFQRALRAQPAFGPVFYGYAQFIGVPAGRATATFDDVAAALDVIAGDLGFRDVELLPFFASPQKDGGYDVSDHAVVADDLGGDAAFDRFMRAAVARGVRVIADLVCNHVSEEHRWVKALKDGDAAMLRRFVVWDDAVKVGERRVVDKIFNVFLHTRGDAAGEISHVWQIFPDNNPDTMIDVDVGGKRHAVFASFYNPWQWDVSASDPEVLAYYLDVVGRFANLGQMGTRMDAIIHMGKRAGTDNMNLPASQAFMALAKAFAAHVAPGNILLPEANLPWEQAKREWLDPQRAFDGVVENTAGDALISFDAHRALWRTLLTGRKEPWVDAQRDMGALPPHKSLMVYLGLHDETLVEDDALRGPLLAKGAHEFAGRGVGDSPAALLDGDADRLAAAHALLYGSKGHPAVYYRTVVGAPNDVAYFAAKTEERLAAQAAAGTPRDLAKATDTRDLDRGPIAAGAYERALAAGYKPAVVVRALNALWREHGAIRTNDVEEVVHGDPHVVAFARRATEGSDPPLLQLVNLTDTARTVSVTTSELAKRLGWTTIGALHDVLQGRIDGAPRAAPFRVADGAVHVELPRYGAVFLQRS